MDATGELWRRLARPFELSVVADMLLGLRADVVEAYGAIRLCLSPETDELLRSMPSLSRSLTTSVGGHPVRSRGQIRGPVMWAETLSARAASFGDEDLFICSAPQREYDTPANRALLHALVRIAAARTTLDRTPASWRDDPRVREARAVARRAHDWTEHPSLSRVGRAAPSARELKRVRGGKAGVRYGPALSVLRTAAESLGPDDLVTLADERTRRQHQLLVMFIHELEARGMTVPAIRVEGAAVLAGPITFVHRRHRAAAGGLHGIVVGHVLVHAFDDEPRESSGTRIDRRTTVVVRGPQDVRLVVDQAVRLAREAVEGATAASRVPARARDLVPGPID
jgi:hypothetical protein